MNGWMRIIIAGIVILLVGCSQVKDSVDAEYELDSYREQIINLSSQLEETIQERDWIVKKLDYSRVMEVTDTSLYRLRSDFYNEPFITETIIETNRRGFKLESENIYDFKVSNDNKYIAILFFDMENLDEQRLIVYDHSGNELYEYSMNDFWGQLSEGQYSGDEVVKFYGFSEMNEYLWGGLRHELEIGVFFSINVKTGELVVYATHNIDVYRELKEEYPYNF
ncbi:MAG: hypothetical protein U9Q80_05800 [Bacillota bacterium]|nr:hypothetical protein [Bacillota bacterium]